MEKLKVSAKEKKKVIMELWKKGDNEKASHPASVIHASLPHIQENFEFEFSVHPIFRLD